MLWLGLSRDAGERAQVTILMYIVAVLSSLWGVYCPGCGGQALLTAVGSICNASNLLLSAKTDELMCLSCVCPEPVIPSLTSAADAACMRWAVCHMTRRLQ